jgi:endoglucanase
MKSRFSTFVVGIVLMLMTLLLGCNAKAGQPESDAALKLRVDAVQKFRWFGEWTPDVKTEVQNTVKGATSEKRAQLVLYYITNRDIGQFSSGGAKGAEAYEKFVRAFSAGIGNWPADVALEPDSLGHVLAMSPEKGAERIALIKFAATTIMANNPNARVYLDATHPKWLQPQQAAALLLKAGIANVRGGFAVNVSNFQTTEECVKYVHALSPLVNGKHAIIDTSRNGAGPANDGEWCNPPGRMLGRLPTYKTGDLLIDLFGWVKNPAESDGEKNGGIPAGQYHPKYLQELARNAKF